MLLVACVFGEPQATRSLNSAPQPTTDPASTLASTNVLSDRFGFVWAAQRGLSGVTVQQETGRGPLELPTQQWRFSACGCAVSPDGTRIAYWAGSAPGTIEMRIVDVAVPGLGTTIYKPPADKRWSALAWSGDGSGILFSLEDRPTAGGPVGNPSGTALLVIEATGGAARTLATGDGVYVPLGWDRAAGVAAAGLSGEGGYMTGYLTARTSGDPALRKTAMPESIGMPSVRVSVDQRFVLGVFSSGQGNALRWWPLADAGAMITGPRMDVQPTWRPGSTQIAWVDRLDLRLLDVVRDVRSSGGTLPPGDYTTITFRVDGSALAAAQGTSGSSYVLLEIPSGRSESLRATGYIVGAVRIR